MTSVRRSWRRSVEPTSFLFDEGFKHPLHPHAVDADRFAERGDVAAVRIGSQHLQRALLVIGKRSRPSPLPPVFGGGNELLIGLSFSPRDRTERRLPRASGVGWAKGAAGDRWPTIFGAFQVLLARMVGLRSLRELVPPYRAFLDIESPQAVVAGAAVIQSGADRG